MKIYKNKRGQKIVFYAYNAKTLKPVTRDAKNIVGHLSKDTKVTKPIVEEYPTELNVASHSGVYFYNLTQEETDAELIIFSAKSVTPDVVIESQFILVEPEVAEIKSHSPQLRR